MDNIGLSLKHYGTVSFECDSSLISTVDRIVGTMIKRQVLSTGQTLIIGLVDTNWYFSGVFRPSEPSRDKNSQRKQDVIGVRIKTEDTGGGFVKVHVDIFAQEKDGFSVYVDALTRFIGFKETKVFLNFNSPCLGFNGQDCYVAMNQSDLTILAVLGNLKDPVYNITEFPCLVSRESRNGTWANYCMPLTEVRRVLISQLDKCDAIINSVSV